MGQVAHQAGAFPGLREEYSVLPKNTTQCPYEVNVMLLDTKYEEHFTNI